MAEGALILNIDLVGYRAGGRFASAEGALKAAKAAILPELRDEIEAAFHDAAPFYEQPPDSGREGEPHFRDSFISSESEPTDDTFRITLATDMADLANWLAAGDYRIEAKNRKALHFYTWSGEWFRKAVNWHTEHSQWELEALAKSEAAAEEAARHIVAYVVAELPFGNG